MKKTPSRNLEMIIVWCSFLYFPCHRRRIYPSWGLKTLILKLHHQHNKETRSCETITLPCLSAFFHQWVSGLKRMGPPASFAPAFAPKSKEVASASAPKTKEGAAARAKPKPLRGFGPQRAGNWDPCIHFSQGTRKHNREASGMFLLSPVLHTQTTVFRIPP